MDSYFNEGEEIEDYLDLYVLRANEELLESFSAIFRGSTASTIARIFVLKGLAADKVLTSWSPNQLRTIFNVMNTDKLDAIIARLRGSPILNYDPNDGLYRLSDIGRVAISSPNSITSFSQEDDTGLGFMFAQLAGNDSMGLDQSPEALRHILYRLNSLREDFEDSIISGSERRIKESERKLESVQKLVGKNNSCLAPLCSTAVRVLRGFTSVNAFIFLVFLFAFSYFLCYKEVKKISVRALAFQMHLGSYI